tara:strand:+ start:466 stop:993 length:528 start_codon:yes stop_codon:yes gene_type:complete
MTSSKKPDLGNYEKYVDSAKRGPISFTARVGWVIFVIVLIIGVFSGVAGLLMTTGLQMSSTALREAGPAALNAKYEWFKDSYARLDSLGAQIEVHNERIEALVEVRDTWEREDRQAHRQYISERTGIIGSYNKLASEYNSEMAKFHTRFVNIGKLPAGGDGEIPREVAPYKTSSN